MVAVEHAVERDHRGPAVDGLRRGRVRAEGIELRLQALEAAEVVAMERRHERVAVETVQVLHQRVRRAVVAEDLVLVLARIAPQRQPVLGAALARVGVGVGLRLAPAEEALDVGVEVDVRDRASTGRRSR